MNHATIQQLESGLGEICRSPKDQGVLEFIVRRPKSGHREILCDGELDLVSGLVGDNWKTRCSELTPDGTPDPDTQLNIMNSRVIALIAQDKDRWQLSGDQLFVDMDLSLENLPPGARLVVGSAIIEVTDPPHKSCKTFASRFGTDATVFVNSTLGKQLRLRGLNARVIRAGTIRVGDQVKKLVSADSS
jgi:hypothetical protein